MTVKQLIEQLSKFPQDKQIILSHTDHTDWDYSVELTSDLVSENEWYNEDSDSEENVVVIDCRFW